MQVEAVQEKDSPEINAPDLAENPEELDEFQSNATSFSDVSPVNESPFSSKSTETDNFDSASFSADNTSTSPGNSQPAIVRLAVESDYLQMESGEIRTLSVWGVDEQGKKIPDIATRVECFVVEGDPLIIKLFPGCEISAVFPGKLRLQARYITNSNIELTSPLIDIDVITRQVVPVAGIYDFTLNAGQTELWLSFPGLVSQDYYRATLSGELPDRSRIEVIPGFDNSAGVCRNTLPAGSQKVACYFQAESDEVVVVISNEHGLPFQGRLLVEPVREQKQFEVSYTKEAARQIYLDTPVTQYVFANEVGANNTHFYRFKPDVKPPGPVKVTLSEYTHLIALRVTWGNQVCTSDMMRISDKKTTCIISSYLGGDITIEVEASGVDLLNAPAAVDGGTHYTLLVEQLD